MRLLSYALMVVLLISCSLDDSNDMQYRFELLPITEVELPDSVRFGQVYSIRYTYAVPTTCHAYNDLYYVSEGNVRTIAVITTVLEEAGNVRCEALTGQFEERSFNFYVNEVAGVYVFRLWQGTDAEGHDVYRTYEIPIE